MDPTLLTLPPELLIHIMGFLPIRSILRFSETCRSSHELATSSLHTLSLGIYASRLQSMLGRLGATRYPDPQRIASAFENHTHPSSTMSGSERSSEMDYDMDSEVDCQNPFRVSVLVPEGQTFGYATLLSFHTALTSSILTRHGGTLRNLHLSLWTLTTPVAKTLANLPALRALSLRIEDFPTVRAVPRGRVAGQYVEQRAAWDILANEAVWNSRLNALRIEGGELTTKQLARLLRKNRWCRELWLCKCNNVGKEVWGFLGSEWEGRTELQILGIMRCGGQLDDGVLGIIGKLHALQFLTLQGCHGVESEEVEMRNKDVWHVPELVPPRPRVHHATVSTVIEVDPAYIE